MIRYIVEIGEGVDMLQFSSAVRDPVDPTNATYPDSVGDPILFPVKLVVPKVNNKISDSISGTVIINQQRIEILNQDGRYDDVEALGWFNIPLVLKRSDADKPTIADFSPIFSGVVDYPVVTQSLVRLFVNNVYRSLTEEVTKTFNTTDYPNLPDTNLDKNIPIGYGPFLINVPLFEVDTNKYIAIDPDYLTSVTTVYDADGVSISFTVDGFGVISATDGKTADVAGATGNTIGDIITSEIALKSLITYTADNWDIFETGEYITNSAKLNFYFSGGSVKQLIDAALKSDNAFLFTKNDGLLTIRQWGRLYKQHTINSWQFMKFPEKNYQEAQRFFNSLALVQFDKNITTGKYQSQLASGTGPLFGKGKSATYPTDLYLTGEVLDLGSRMIKRFGILSEIMKILSGFPTIDINLLDIVNIDVTINGRVFSIKTEWVVREVDPGQDVLSLEARSGFIDPEVIDGTLSQPGINLLSGVLSQPSTEDISGVLNQSLSVTGG